MGFLDDLSDSFSDAKAAVGRSTSTMKLNSQLNEIKRRREGLVTQLGASLYDVTKDDPKLRAGREALYDGIAQCDIERSQLSAQIAQIEAQAQQMATYTCPRCGTKVPASNQFCAGCGLPVVDVIAASTTMAVPQAAPAGTAHACPSCGAPVESGDTFCMSCGTRLGPASAPQAAPTQPAG